MAKITAIIAYDNKNGQILFSEGCDPDGYSYHQVIIPRKYITDADLEKMHESIRKHFEDTPNNEYFNLGETEANHINGEYELFTVTMKTIEIPDIFEEIR